MLSNPAKDSGNRRGLAIVNCCLCSTDHLENMLKLTGRQIPTLHTALTPAIVSVMGLRFC